MNLSNVEMARLGELLDEALTLTPEQRGVWLDSLSSVDQPMLRTLRDALLVEETATDGPFDRPPRIEAGVGEDARAAGRQPGERLGPYQLLHPLGSGGMADVWLACRTDGAFERQVALKIPRLHDRPVEMTARFALECNILAALECPGIARLYDAGVDAGGVPYIAMEYVQGEPLVAWCDARGLDEAARIRVFLQVLDVVAYAHQRQVMHRDLKPSNILVTGQGEVRLLDFGTARLLQPKTDGASLTRAYGLALTPEYASPELLRGEVIDSRGDIYSLGVVLHELLTGTRPAQPTRPGTGDTRRLRGALRDVVMTALQPDRGDRYPDAAAFAAALRPFVDGNAHDAADGAVVAAGGRIRRRVYGALAAAAAIALAVAFLASRPPVEMRSASIAVLPFADLSDTQDQAYLADGIAEEILDKLDQNTDLRVIARTSSFVFRGKQVVVAEVGRKLDVTHVLEGSVRRSGDSLRVTAQIIATADSSTVWSSTFNRRAADLFAIQDEIAVAVAGALRPTLNLNRADVSAKIDFAAYDLAKQAEYAYWRRAPGDIDRSVELFEQALKLDPHYAWAWAALAGAYNMQAWSMDPPSDLLRAKQGQAALRAVELDPSLAFAHVRLAHYYGSAGEEGLARKHIDRALELDPDDPLVLGYFYSEAIAAGDLDAALAYQRRALVRDPMNSVTRQTLGVILTAQGRLHEALATYRTLEELNPDIDPDAQVDIPRLLVLLGRDDEAASEAMRLPAGEFRDHALAFLSRTAAHREEADAALRRFEEHTLAMRADMPGHQLADSLRLAENYTFRGRHGEALDTLTEEFAALVDHTGANVHVWRLKQELRLSPFLKSLHADPRWATLLAKSP
jgi:TolB-like protein/tRNA A-37 threonylcarbamoyl transferase component Bud32/Flp pilus assembly protein TadD